MSKFFWLVAFFAFLLWAVGVHPNQIRERVIMEILKTYQMELQTGVKESRLPAMLEEKAVIPTQKEAEE